MLRSIFFLIVGLSLVTVADARSQRCKADKAATTPTIEFVDNGDGTVSHLETGLMWKRCAEGQTGAQCEGKATPYYWDDAAKRFSRHAFAGKSDWRMPTIDELKGIVEKRCKGPSFNLEIFPNAPTSVLWSSSEIPGRDDKAWQMYSPSGVAIKGNKAVEGRIRLVRGGR